MIHSSISRLPLMKATACSSPYVSLSQSSRMCAPRLKPTSLFKSGLMTSMVYIIVSNAWMPPCGIIGPQVISSCRSWTIMRPPRLISPSISAAFLVGHVKLNTRSLLFDNAGNIDSVSPTKSKVTKLSMKVMVFRRYSSSRRVGHVHRIDGHLSDPVQEVIFQLTSKWRVNNKK